jgi:Cu-processing system permease protein
VGKTRDSFDPLPVQFDFISDSQAEKPNIKSETPLHIRDYDVEMIHTHAGNDTITAMLTIVWLTWKEALLRRAPLISLLIGVLLCVGAFIPLTGKLLLLPPAKAHQIYASLYVFLATDIIKFFASVFGIALASGAISAEIERGVLSSILPKPITRFSVYAGKWLGLVLFITANIVLWDGILWLVATYRNPEVSHANIWHAFPYLLLYPAVFTTLALLYSTFASFPLAAGLSILSAGVGWSEGILYLLNHAFDIALLAKLSKLAGYIVPLGRMSRWVTEGLGPLPMMKGNLGSRSPFNEIVAMPSDLTYIAIYVVTVFVIGSIVFGRRDV